MNHLSISVELALYQISLKPDLNFAHSYIDRSTVHFRFNTAQIDLCISQSNCSFQNRFVLTGMITYIHKRDKDAVIVECADCTCS